MIEDEVDSRFIKVRIEDTRCPEAIRAVGITEDCVYLLRERIDCKCWDHVAPYFVRPDGGKYILTDPPAARRYLTVRPEQVVQALKKHGVW